MVSKRVRVNKDNLVVLKCPHCATMKLISVGKFKDKRHVLTVKCDCENSFSVSLDFRLHYRKSVNISGKYSQNTSNPPSMQSLDMKCQIVDLSLGGVGLSIPGAHDLCVGDELVIAFTLDDKTETHIQCKVVVRMVGQGFVGCQFDEVDSPANDKALESYLML